MQWRWQRRRRLHARANMGSEEFGLHAVVQSDDDSRSSHIQQWQLTGVETVGPSLKTLRGGSIAGKAPIAHGRPAMTPLACAHGTPSFYYSLQLPGLEPTPLELLTPRCEEPLPTELQKISCPWPNKSRCLPLCSASVLKTTGWTSHIGKNHLKVLPSNQSNSSF